MKKLIWISIALWAASLPLNAIILYDNQGLKGYMVLVIGSSLPMAFIHPVIGLAGFVSYFPWYANLFFWLSILTAGRKEKSWPLGFSLTAALMAAGTPWVKSIPQSAAGPGPEVYGYGLGAFVWWAAMLLLPIAFLSKRLRPGTTQLMLMLIFGALLLVVGGKAALDRINPNTEEQEYFAKHNVLIKYAAVCEEPVFEASNQIETPSILEISGKPGYFSVTRLLRAGFPVVRERGWDHSYHQTNGHRNMVMTLPSETADLFLTEFTDGRVHDRRGGTKNWRELKLATAGGETVIEQRWYETGRKDSHGKKYYCPTFIHDKKSESPMKLLLNAIKLNPLGWSPRPSDYDIYIEAEATASKTDIVLGKLEPGMFSNFKCQNNSGRLESVYQLNKGLDDGKLQRGYITLGYTTNNATTPELTRLGQLKNRRMYSSASAGHNITCSQNKMYLYKTNRIQGGKHKGQLSISISERSLNDFDESWNARIYLDLANEAFKRPRIAEVKYINDSFHFDVVDLDSGRVFKAVVEGIPNDGEEYIQDIHFPVSTLPTKPWHKTIYMTYGEDKVIEPSSPSVVQKSPSSPNRDQRPESVDGQVERVPSFKPANEGENTVYKGPHPKQEDIARISIMSMVATIRERDRETPGTIGIEQLLFNGSIRFAKDSEVDRWYVESAMKNMPWSKVLDQPSSPVYKILRPIRLPEARYGVLAAIFVTTTESGIPEGPLGHSTLIDMNDLSCLGVHCVH